MSYFSKKFNDYLKETGEVGYVDQVVHSIVYASGLPSVKIHEIVIFENEGIGEVISLTRDHVEILPYFRDQIKVGNKIARTARILEIPVGEGFLGTTINPLGRSLNSRSPVVDGKSRFVFANPPGISARDSVIQPLELGVSIVDLTIPLGKGQRELIIGDRKTGKSQFLLQVILAQAMKGTLCIYAAIGKRRSDIKKLENYFEQMKIHDKTIIVATTSEDPTGLIFLTPYVAMSMAEYFAEQGKDILLILDDLTNHARFYREITLLAQRFPGRSSYPGDIFYTHARLLERAGKFKKGSISCLAVAESILGDFSGYIQSNLMAMTDGHIYFDSELFNQGRRPAVNPFLSVTRVGLQAQLPLHRDLTRQLNSFLVRQERLRELMHFGAELSEQVQRELDLGDKVMTFFNQPPAAIVPLELSIYVVASLWAGTWKGIPVEQFRKDVIGVFTNYSKNDAYRANIQNMIKTSNLFKELVDKVKEAPVAVK